MSGTYPWTDESVEILREMRAAGHSASAIAKALRCTRNSVMGKCSRLGIKSPPKERPDKPADIAAATKPRTRDKIMPSAPSPSAFSKVVAPSPIAPTPKAPNAEPVPLLKLKRHHCRAVLEKHGEDGLAMYCGGTRLRGSSWCGFHREMYVEAARTAVSET